jgi:hypothetical protein
VAHPAHQVIAPMRRIGRMRRIQRIMSHRIIEFIVRIRRF